MEFEYECIKKYRAELSTLASKNQHEIRKNLTSVSRRVNSSTQTYIHQIMNWISASSVCWPHPGHPYLSCVIYIIASHHLRCVAVWSVRVWYA